MLVKWDNGFESSVNSEGIETFVPRFPHWYVFESSVNSEGIETGTETYSEMLMFESSVNSEGIETKAKNKVYRDRV